MACHPDRVRRNYSLGTPTLTVLKDYHWNPQQINGAEVFGCVMPCSTCDDYLLEAWERQTTGGLIIGRPDGNQWGQPISYCTDHFICPAYYVTDPAKSEVIELRRS